MFKEKLPATVTNEMLYEKLTYVERLLKSLLKKEVKELSLLGLEKKDVERLIGEKSKKIFEDVLEWKLMIWDNCPFKKSKQEGIELTYTCQKINKPCNFSICPKNVL